MTHPAVPVRALGVTRTFSLVIFALFAVFPVASAEPASAQGSYKSPQEAVDALVAAVKVGSVDAIVGVLGPAGRRLAASGDPVADKGVRERFETAYAERHEVKQEGSDRATLIVGKLDYPFPIPLVGQAGAWRFDAEAGAEEILARRIGENELATIATMRAYVDAQREYAEVDRDGKGVQFARRVLSQDGKTDGLYWPTAEGEPESPLGPLLATARAAGYGPQGQPYHGYYFRILLAQGEAARGGARAYIFNDRMIGGFGLIATPAEYGNSGVMTFIVNHDGDVYEKDLGSTTPRMAVGITTFDPDPSWSKVGLQ